MRPRFPAMAAANPVIRLRRVGALLRHHRRDRQLLGGAHQLPVPGPVPTSPANNDFKPGFATALMNKDLGLAMDAVASTGSAAPLGSLAAEIYAKFAADNADKDFSAVIEMLRRS